MQKPSSFIGANQSIIKKTVTLIKPTTDLLGFYDGERSGLDFYHQSISIDANDIDKQLYYCNDRYKLKASIFSHNYSARETLHKLSGKYRSIPVYNLLQEAGLFTESDQPTNFMVQNDLAAVLIFPEDSNRKPLNLITAKGFSFLEGLLNNLTHNILYNLY